MFLIDTHVWLERLFDSEHSDDVGKLLNHYSSDKLFATAFSLNGISMILKRHQHDDVLARFVLDVFVDGGSTLIHLEPEDIKRILRTMDQCGLDYHDAHQYVAAEKYHLTIVSYNDAFDSTPLGRKTPAQIMVMM
ncbi:MAG: PIN domain-containing protein [Candidatus Hinthialibacter antarcticus]|nr:PIN domain-containing protein [Candidatus Hinthialibacter antarcticus]